MLVSVFTDASMCPHYRVAGWGGWAKSDRGVCYEGGPLRARYESSDAAEIAASINAIHMALRHGVAQPGDDLIVQCDNMTAVAFLSHSQFSSGRNQYVDSVVPYALRMKAQRQYDVARNPVRLHETPQWVLFQLSTKHDLCISGRHVKGHVHKGESRHAVNRRCDRLAKEGMHEMRKRYGYTGEPPR